VRTAPHFPRLPRAAAAAFVLASLMAALPLLACTSEVGDRSRAERTLPEERPTPETPGGSTGGSKPGAGDAGSGMLVAPPPVESEPAMTVRPPPTGTGADMIEDPPPVEPGAGGGTPAQPPESDPAHIPPIPRGAQQR
jgi:hypothetical protein